MKRLALIACFSFLSFAQISAAQQPEDNRQVWSDDRGNIFVKSNDGRYVQVADTKHCNMEMTTQDQQMAICQVPDPIENQTSSNVSPMSTSHQLEIYQKGARKLSIDVEGPIQEWHLWDHDRYAAVHWGTEGLGTYSLYELATARMMQTVPEPVDKSTLPQWAKDRGQIEDESVSTGKAAAEERMRWLAKVMREIEQIKPGMKREDLSKIFTTEGGMYTRLQQTFVYIDCPYIKVPVTFKAVNDKRGVEDPEDIIESISGPYLQWTTAD